MKGIIQATTMVNLPLAKASEALLHAPQAVFGTGRGVDETCDATFAMNLDVDLGSGARIHQEVTVRVGAPRSTSAGQVLLPMAWRVSGKREHLFPAFDGVLELFEAGRGTQLRLRGTYVVPLGLLGRFGDGVLGRRIARRSLCDLLERAAAQLEREPNATPSPSPEHDGHRRIALREEQHSEIYFG